MGRRILAVLLSMAIVLAVFVKSDAINGYAEDYGNTETAYTDTYIETEEVADDTIPVLPKEDTPTDATEVQETATEETADVSGSDFNAEVIAVVEEAPTVPDVSDNSDVVASEEIKAEIPDTLTKDISGNETAGEIAGELTEDDESQADVAFLSMQSIEDKENMLGASMALSLNAAPLAGTMLLEAVPSGVADPTDEGALIESVTVSLIDAGGTETALNPSEEVKMSLNDTLKVHYTFKQPLVINPTGFTPNPTLFPGVQVTAGEQYKVYGIPKVCSKAGGINIDVENGGEKLGVLSIDEDGDAIFTVADTFTEVVSAEDAYAGRELSLNLNKADNGDVERYELTFAHNTYTVRIKEFMPQPPRVTKSASSIDAEGNVTWTVRVTNDEKPIAYAGGLTITDTFSEGQDYVEGSLARTGVGAVTPAVSGNTISWTYTDNTPSAVAEFTYKTHIDLLALVKDENAETTVNKNVTNSVTVTAPATDDYDALSLTAGASSTITKDVHKWVDKSGTPVDANGEAAWTIIVRNNGFTLSDVVLHDTIAADGGVTINMTDISVTDASGNDVSFTESSDGNAHEIAFAGNMAGDAVYTVTYKTAIQNYAQYLKKNHTVPSNNAWLTYSYDASGTGEPVAVTGPGMEAHFTGSGMMAKAAIKKTAGNIDRVSHTMEWLVEVNNNKQALTGVSITDAVPAGQIYVGISDVKIDDVSVSDSMYSVNASDLTNVVITFGDNIEGKKASFVITTKLTDSENMIWAGNAEKEYINTVTLNSEGNAPVTDTAKKVYDSKVIEKSAGNYDYSTHKIRYTVTVNANRMAMRNVVVTDPLDSRVEYVDGSSSFAGTVYNSGTNTLTFNLGDITDTVTITFYAKVKDGDSFANNGSFTIHNAAGLVSTEYSTATESACDTAVQNNVIKKKGVRNEEVINYTVEVNAAMQDLYRGGVNEVVIRDTMGASLVLDDETVKLYEATVSANGRLTKGTLVTGATVRVDRSNPRTVLEVVIPKTGGDKAYILEYTARALKVKAGEFTNNVVLAGYGDSLINTSDVSYEERHFSNVSFNKYVYYITGLKDEDDNLVPVEGAHFELIDPSRGNIVVAEADSDADGEIVFVGKLEENHTYILKETSTKDGYDIPAALQQGIEVTTGTKGYNTALAVKDANTVYNPKYDPSKYPAPAPSTSSSSSSKKPKSVEGLADVYIAPRGRKLAKTGGFMGTAAGYGSGIAFVVTGLCMVAGRKKKKK